MSGLDDNIRNADDLQRKYRAIAPDGIIQIERTTTKTPNGFVKPGGWGGNPDPNTWQAVRMKQKPKQFKVVDNKKKNIATDFKSRADAEDYIDFHKKEPDVIPPQPEPGPQPQPQPQPPITPPVGDKTLNKDGILMIYPTANGNEQYEFSHEEKIRNYASGAPSEPTTECTNTKTKWENQCFMGFCKIPTYGKQDKMSKKMKGGRHSSSGGGKTGSCYAFELPTTGKADGNLAKEGPHPKYDFHDIPWENNTMGKSILDKWVGFQDYFWNVNNDTQVRGESYVNEDPFNADGSINNNNWKLCAKMFDDKDGKYGSNKDEHTTAKPYTKRFGDLTTLRVDGPKHIQVKYLCAREFVPPTTT